MLHILIIKLVKKLKHDDNGDLSIFANPADYSALRGVISLSNYHKFLPSRKTFMFLQCCIVILQCIWFLTN